MSMMNKKLFAIFSFFFALSVWAKASENEEKVQQSGAGASPNVVKIIDFTKQDPLASVDLSGKTKIKPTVVVKSQRENGKTVFLQVSGEDSGKSRVVAKSVSYTVRGKTYRTLATADNFVQEGEASWYGPGFHGRKTASGEVFNMNAMTAAHKRLPFGARVKVTNLANGKSIVLRINDRGPFHGNRVIDLSKAAAIKLGVIKAGRAKVRIEACD